MQTAEEITTAIEKLPRQEYVKILHWFAERDWQSWDEEIADDCNTGKLDFLVLEAMEEKKLGRAERDSGSARRLKCLKGAIAIALHPTLCIDLLIVPTLRVGMPPGTLQRPEVYVDILSKSACVILGYSSWSSDIGEV